MFRNKSVDVHAFAMIPRADIPRSSFRIQQTHKTTFDAGYLVPIYVDEVLPGDSFSVRMTAFTRMATPLFPLMDNLHLDSFFFFIPNRLVWYHWKQMMGEQDNPTDTTSYVIPKCTCPPGGYEVNSLQDYLGLPTVGQIGVGATVEHSALPLRAYNLVWNEWFRDENLQDSVNHNRNTDGPDDPTNYVLLRRGKRHDYFTSCLPWPQKGPSVPLPLGSQAPVRSDGTSGTFPDVIVDPGSALVHVGTGAAQAGQLFADLTQATAATINQLRQSFQVQKLLERDARGGTRYTELVRAHFGVVSPDARLQRPEYLGGGSTPIAINPIAQTSATGVQGGETPMGTLSGLGTAVMQGHGFTQSFTEHGIVLGLVMVRADLTYQQGLRKMWSRSTKFDFYWPAFAMLGEQAVLNKEIYVKGDANDDGVFGYQERWSEYRHHPSRISGLFRSTAAGTLDPWHLAQNFTTLPTLNATFIEEHPPVDRVVAVPSPLGQQFIFDSFFDCRVARPLPLYSVPGLIDHF